MKRKRDRKPIGNYIVKSIYVPLEKVQIWNELTTKSQKEGRSISESVLLAIYHYIHDEKGTDKS